MKNHLIILILVSILILWSGCTDKGNQTSVNVNNIKTFTGDGITFQYPANWKTIENQSRDSIVAVGDPASDDGNSNARVNVIIQKTALPQDQSFIQYYNDTYNQFKSQNLGFSSVSDGNIDVNGVNAYENVYKTNSGAPKQQRAIWVQKGGFIYTILCSAPIAEFNNQHANFDMIINSFKFQ